MQKVEKRVELSDDEIKIWIDVMDEITTGLQADIICAIGVGVPETYIIQEIRELLDYCGAVHNDRNRRRPGAERFLAMRAKIEDRAEDRIEV